MKKKIMLLFMALGVVILFAGCSSLQTAKTEKLQGMALTTTGTSVAHVSGNAAGFYFLWLPVFTGSTQNPGSISVFGEDSCNVTQVTKMVTNQSKAVGGARTIDLTSSSTSNMLLVPIPFLFYWKTATVSGNAVR